MMFVFLNKISSLCFVLVRLRDATIYCVVESGLRSLLHVHMMMMFENMHRLKERDREIAENTCIPCKQQQNNNKHTYDVYVPWICATPTHDPWPTTQLASHELVLACACWTRLQNVECNPKGKRILARRLC